MTTKVQHVQPAHVERRYASLAVIAAILWIAAYQNLRPFADFVTYTLLSLSKDSHLGTSLNFFVYDVPKLLLLLSGMIFLITLLQTFLNPEKVRALVEKRGEGVGNVMALV